MLLYDSEIDTRFGCHPESTSNLWPIIAEFAGMHVCYELISRL